MDQMPARATSTARPDTSVSRQKSPKPHQPARKIGLFGFFGIENFGNDGSMEAMLRFLRKQSPATEVISICGEPDKIAALYDVPAVAISYQPKRRLLRYLNRLCFSIPGEFVSLIQAARQLRQMDLLLVPGTGILDDFTTGPFGMPYWIFRCCALARILGTKVAFVSIGAGPIHHPLSRWLMKSAAGNADYVSYRDDVSFKFMKEIGCDVSSHAIFPDVAFGLPDPIALRPTRPEGEALTVGIGVMTYNGWRGDKARNTAIYDDYIAKMVRFISWLIARNYRVRLLTGDGVDQATIEKILNEIRGPHPENSDAPIVAEYAYSLHDVMRQMAETDIVVATRFHNIVCALKVGRPTLSIGYAAKNDALLASMGLNSFCQSLEDLDFDFLIEQFERLVAGRKTFEQELARRNAEVLAELHRQEAELTERYL